MLTDYVNQSCFQYPRLVVLVNQMRLFGQGESKEKGRKKVTTIRKDLGGNEM